MGFENKNFLFNLLEYDLFILGKNMNSMGLLMAIFTGSQEMV